MPSEVAAATPDIDTLARSFARRLRAANRSPETDRSYLDSVAGLDAYLGEVACRGRWLPSGVNTSRATSKIGSPAKPVDRAWSAGSRALLGVCSGATSRCSPPGSVVIP
jgi:hypothetical protein